MSTVLDSSPGQCFTCLELMTAVDTCTTEDDRVPYGSEWTWEAFDVIPAPRCRDCAVMLGSRHHAYCCVAVCQHGSQHITCLICLPDEEDEDDGD